MSLSQNNINELKESFDYLVKRNYEIQDDVKMALVSEEYLKAIKIISKFIKNVDEFTIITLNMAQKNSEKADNEHATICNKIAQMVEHIKTAHLEVKENILVKYKNKVS